MSFQSSAFQNSAFQTDGGAPAASGSAAAGGGAKAASGGGRTGRNLLTCTEVFNAPSWVKDRGVTVSADATTAPDGTVTADKLIEGSFFRLQQIVQSFLVPAGFHTVSVYAKAAERNWIRLEAQASGRLSQYFDVSAGALGTSTSTAGDAVASITSVGNGWWRCSISGTSVVPGVNAVNVQVCDADFVGFRVGDGVSGIYIWGAQLEAGTLSVYESIRCTVVDPTAAASAGDSSAASGVHASPIAATAVGGDTSAAVAIHNASGSAASRAGGKDAALGARGALGTAGASGGASASAAGMVNEAFGSARAGAGGRASTSANVIARTGAARVIAGAQAAAHCARASIASAYAVAGSRARAGGSRARYGSAGAVAGARARAGGPAGARPTFAAQLCIDALLVYRCDVDALYANACDIDARQPAGIAIDSSILECPDD